MSGFSSPDNISLTSKNVETSLEIIETPEEHLEEKYQLDRCIFWLRENNYEKTCLQFPDKLLNDGVSVALYLQKQLGKTFYILADTAFGSCCVDHISAEHVKGDSIIHFGHACLSHFSKLPVLFIFEKEELEIKKLSTALEHVISTSSSVIIFYDDVYHHLHKDLCDNFKNSNVEISEIVTSSDVFEMKDRKKLYGRAFLFPKDVCEDTVAVFVGDDCVTLQNLSLALPDIKWYLYSKNGKLSMYDISRSKFLMKKFHQVELVKDANVLGILIGTLGIDSYLSAVDRIKILAKNHGKKCYILAVGKPNICKLANFPEVDVFVSISCPENVSKDFKDYYKPVVSIFEVETALGNHLFRTEYLNDFRDVLLSYSALDEIETTTKLAESDVSLTSGKIRSDIKLEDNTSSALQEKLSGALIEAKGAEFLSNRSWRGLQQHSEKEVTLAEMGRSGIPLGYENEYGNFYTVDKNE